MHSNTIHRLSLELKMQACSNDNPYGMSETIYREYFENAISEVIECYGENNNLAIEHINIDLGEICKEDIPLALKNALCEELDKQIITIKSNAGNRDSNNDIYTSGTHYSALGRIESFIHFLCTGLIPWYDEPALFNPETALSETIESFHDKNALLFFFEKIKSNSVALIRLNQIATKEQLTTMDNYLADVYYDITKFPIPTLLPADRVSNVVYDHISDNIDQTDLDKGDTKLEGNRTAIKESQQNIADTLKNSRGENIEIEISSPLPVTHTANSSPFEDKDYECETYTQQKNSIEKGSLSATEAIDITGNAALETSNKVVYNDIERNLAETEERENPGSDAVSVVHCEQVSDGNSSDVLIPTSGEAVAATRKGRAANEYRTSSADKPVDDDVLVVPNKRDNESNYNQITLSDRQLSENLDSLYEQTRKYADFTTLKDERIHTNSAGLVILNPFIVPFFERLGLLDEEHQFKSCEKVIRAVHLLSYLAGTETEDTYSNLPLEKVLCGLDTNFPVNTPFEILPHEKEEAENLLNTVCQHWKPLNNTSIEGLRLSFLQRHGTIEYDDGMILVRVEGKTLDILMEDLPWGTSMFLFPWVKPMFYVEWQPAE